MADARLGDSYSEVLLGGAPSAQLSDVYVEVLTPTRSTTFVGWGIPFSTIGAFLFYALAFLLLKDWK